jgi:hypothetical protein
VVLSTNLRLVDAPGNVLIPAKASGLKKDSVANVSQVITIDRDSLTELAGRIRVNFSRTSRPVSGLSWVYSFSQSNLAINACRSAASGIIDARSISPPLT